MALSNYTELQASVADFLNRSDLTSVIPDFITMAEADFNRTLRVRDMVKRSRAPITSQYVKLPPDFMGMKNIDLLTDPVTPLTYKNLSELDAHRRRDSTGKPLYYAIVQDNIEFAPVPDGDYTIEVVYYGKIEALSSENLTNWLLDNHPDAYLYGTLMHSAPYLQADERVGLWAGKYQQIIGQIMDSDEKIQFSGSTPSISFTPF